MKSKTEKLFSLYLEQRGLYFEYEPYNDGGKNPDFKFQTADVRVLAEVKELENTAHENLIIEQLKINRQFSFSNDPRDFWNLLRGKIDEASTQLKARKEDADNCVVILGKEQLGFEVISPETILYAMYGDIYIQFPINPVSGAISEESTTELKVNGALRKNNPQTRQMRAVHPYVSAVGVVEEFNGRDEYQRNFSEALLKKYRPPTAEACIHYLETEWEKHQSGIPEIYLDPTKMFYRVRAVANPIGIKPLSKAVFAGQWDEVLWPTVVEN